MGLDNGVGNGPKRTKRCVVGQGPNVLHEVEEIRTIDKLHGEVAIALWGGAGVVNLNDAVVMEPPHGLGFAVEAL